MPSPFENKTFDVEHALNMYATGFVTLPAFAIYDKEAIAALLPQIQDCHIYLIGAVPRVEFVDVEQRGGELITSYVVKGERHALHWPMPENAHLAGDGERGWYVIDSDGQRSFPATEAATWRLAHQAGVLDFSVLYVGQAYGTDGSPCARSAAEARDLAEDRGNGPAAGPRAHDPYAGD